MENSTSYARMPHGNSAVGSSSAPPWQANSSVHNHWASRIAFGMLLISDIISFITAIGLGAIAAVFFHHFSGKPLASHLSFTEVAWQMTLVSLPIFAVCALYFSYVGHYRDRIPFWSETRQVVGASFCCTLAAGFLAFFFKVDNMRLVHLAPWFCFPFLLIIYRNFSKQILDRLGFWRVPVMLIGSPENTSHALDILHTGFPPGVLVKNVLRVEDAVNILETSNGNEFLKSAGVVQLILALDIYSPVTQRLVAAIARRRLPFALMPQIADLPVQCTNSISYFSHDAVIMTYRSSLDQRLHRALKLSFDVLAALTLFILVLPVFALLFVLVKRDGGPAMFGHARIGRNGQTFRCLKFRSMVPNAGEVLHDLLENDPAARAEWAATQKLTNDPRITKVGRILRKTSLDELPQLLNVLRLEMSLVGPRPIVGAETAHYGEDIAYYYATRPGITGLWQVSGRSDTSYERRVQLDRWYVRNWTLWHDIAILLKTLPAVLFQSGAR
ncbi:undecaprenyl-phosphate galactose phosphotransferase WbaP [Kozakia baliensis]|uniref:undecaprenyl-phosphate galactose phosphotransferase WbaP n=1 Tax=Kozakia baliensis TaxID=153496 RepID=UPI00087DC290|nr:undecaprenyl-phosphate galactose phosphotransferase WbaP [Kozakia baliensis]AOX19531.1 hypothetical protein A0U90_03595 [Kozakia baliensis]